MLVELPPASRSWPVVAQEKLRHGFSANERKRERETPPKFKAILEENRGGGEGSFFVFSGASPRGMRMTDRPSWLPPASSFSCQTIFSTPVRGEHRCEGCCEVAGGSVDRGIVERRNGNSKNSEIEGFLCRSFHHLGFDFLILRRPDGCSKLFFLSSFSYYFCNNLELFFLEKSDS